MKIVTGFSKTPSWFPGWKKTPSQFSGQEKKPSHTSKLHGKNPSQFLGRKKTRHIFPNFMEKPVAISGPEKKVAISRPEKNVAISGPKKINPSQFPGWSENSPSQSPSQEWKSNRKCILDYHHHYDHLFAPSSLYFCGLILMNTSFDKCESPSSSDRCSFINCSQENSKFTHDSHLQHVKITHVDRSQRYTLKHVNRNLQPNDRTWVATCQDISRCYIKYQETIVNCFSFHPPHPPETLLKPWRMRRQQAQPR